MAQTMVDVEKARQQHQTSMRTLGKSLLWIATAALLFGLAAIGPASEFLISHGDRQTPIGVCFFLTFLAFVLYAGSGYAFHCSQPIPNEPLHAPAPYRLDTDQSWRKRTRLRFLENLKKEVSQIEHRIQNSHESAVRNYESIPHVISISEYREAKSQLYALEAQKEHLLSELPSSYERIERIFGGDVNKELLDIKETMKKLGREKQEEERKLATWQSPCTIRHENQAAVDQCESNRASRQAQLHKSIHSIDVRVIELETDLEELQKFDFQQLWKELDLPGPPTLTRVTHEGLADLKAKVETLNTIPTLQKRGPQPSTSPSKEEARLKNKARCEADIERLKGEKEQKLRNSKTTTEAKRWENFYDDAIQEAEEEFKKYLR